MKILFLIISIILNLIFIILFMMMGENGFNKYCKNANLCPGSVRCMAKSKDELNCFEPKRKKEKTYEKR